MLHIDATNFTRFISASVVTLILFSPPSGHHEPASLRPQLAAATEQLMRSGEDVKYRIAVCTQPELAEGAGVKVLPALRLFRKDGGDKPDVYRGPLEPAAALISRLRREDDIDPLPLVAVSAKEVRDEVDAVSLAAVLFAEPESKGAKSFTTLFRVARPLRLQMSFILAAPSLQSLFDPVGEGTAATRASSMKRELMLFRTAVSHEHDEEVVVYPAPVVDLAMARQWLEMHSLPALGEIGPHNYELYEHAQRHIRDGYLEDGTIKTGEGYPTSQLPTFWLFLNSSCCQSENAQTRALLAEEGRSRRGHALFVWLDGDRYAHHARSLAATPGVLPVLAAEHKSQHFVYSGSLANKESIRQWVDLVQAGTLRPTLRSAPPPLHNLGPVQTIVAATFDHLVLDTSGPDVLLFVHAAWCAECRAIATEVAKLGLKWQDEDNLRVGTFDAGANDLPRMLGVAKLPSVLLFVNQRVALEGGVEGVQRVPYDLSAMTTEGELSDAIVQYASKPLAKPTNADQLQTALEMLPRFQAEAQKLMAENRKLRTQLAEARRQVEVAAETGDVAVQATSADAEHPHDA